MNRALAKLAIAQAKLARAEADLLAELARGPEAPPFTCEQMERFNELYRMRAYDGSTFVCVRVARSTRPEVTIPSDKEKRKR